jgi:hypothetical protein
MEQFRLCLLLLGLQLQPLILFLLLAAAPRRDASMIG